MKILISGGHITPALALIEYIKTIDTIQLDIVFAGRKYSQTKIKQPSWEQNEVEKQGISFVSFDAPRLSFHSITSIISLLFLFPVSFIRACILMLAQRPSIFVSFGSYQAVPLALAAWCFRIPIVTHEQTRAIGIANKVIGTFAKKIAVSFPETVSQVPKSKAVLTGNLIRRQLLHADIHKPEWLKTVSKKPILYITGGNQGSEVINTVVGQALPRLTKRWFVIHQCGNAHASRNYKHELEHAQSKLPSAQKFSYIVKEWLHEEDLSWVYNKAQIIITRAGANTLQELQYYAIPSVLIPLPFSRNDEQLLGAESLSKKGGAYLLHQKDLNPHTLVEALQVVQDQHDDMKKQLKKLPLILDADKQLFDLITSIA